MKRRLMDFRPVVFCCVFSFLFLPAAAEVPADQKTAAELLPDSTVVYAEVKAPGALLELLLEHPARQRLEQLDRVQQALASPRYAQFQAVVKLIERKLGMTWREAVGAATAGGVSIGYDLESNGVALFIQAGDQKTLEKLRDTFLELARNDARRKGNDDPIKSVRYREIAAYSVGDVRFTTLGRLLVLVNNDDLGKQVLDNYLDGGEDTLAVKKSFQSGRGSNGGHSSLWSYLDIDALREAGALEGLQKGKTGNVLVELLVGGLIGTAQHTPYVTGSVNVERERLALRITAPHESDWVGPAREYYFGPAGEGTAPPLLQPRETLLSLSTYRNVSGMWLNSAEIFEDNVDAGIAQAGGTLSTLFSGKHFGEDVLGAFHPGVQFVAVRQQFRQEPPIPAIKLPAFALVFRFKEPEKMRGDFRRMFQSLVGFLNIVGAQNGQPQLDLRQESLGESLLVSASYVPAEDEADSEEARINFNFSPSVAFAGDRFILASTKPLARELIEVTAQSGDGAQPAEEELVTNTELDAQFSPVRGALADNRKHLVARSILSEGKEREEAERDVDLLLEALGMVRNVRLKLAAGNETIQFDFDVHLAE